ncbi:MAG: XRE family transcriptional regulator [Armatimonadetes bacterium]|nr:XRE family transcriptional regulator [Armatimonadota bacterium]
MSNRYHGSDFDDFLAEEGLLGEAEAVGVKRAIALQVAQMMNTEHLSKSEMSRRMNISRSTLERLLSARSNSATLHTLEQTAQALGKRLRIEFAT